MTSNVDDVLTSASPSKDLDLDLNLSIDIYNYVKEIVKVMKINSYLE